MGRRRERWLPACLVIRLATWPFLCCAFGCPFFPMFFFTSCQRCGMHGAGAVAKGSIAKIPIRRFDSWLAGSQELPLGEYLAGMVGLLYNS